MATRILCESRTAILVCDDRGPGHANHVYEVMEQGNTDFVSRIEFQKGPIQERGVNGVQNEDLLMIVMDRLIGFQTGDYACDENEEALKLLVQATAILQLRTAKREARGVERTSQK